VKNNRIYYDYYTKIPVVTISNDDIWVIIQNTKIRKPIISMINKLNKENINFLFKSPLIIFDHLHTEDQKHKLNIESYISCIMYDDKFFRELNKIGFDYSKNLTSYIIKYSCYEIFQSVYKPFQKEALSKNIDFYTNKEYYNIKDEILRDYIISLERDVKINMIL